MIHFNEFHDELIPIDEEIDVNIGTNVSPMRSNGRYRLLVDPLFQVCEKNSKEVSRVTSLCLAVSNYTGFATFNVYNKEGVSSSLAHVAPGTSHEALKVLSKRTVLVLEARVLFLSIVKKRSSIFRLKMDMQGYELSALRNVKDILQASNLVVHIMAECFCPNPNGSQIYEIDNSCAKISSLLRECGYETSFSCQTEWSDVFAYKKGLATEHLSESAFE